MLQVVWTQRDYFVFSNNNIYITGNMFAQQVQGSGRKAVILGMDLPERLFPILLTLFMGEVIS